MTGLEAKVIMKDKQEPGETPAIIEAGPDGIEIGFEGYGTKDMASSPVIYIERYQGKIRLYAWADITKEDPSHIIDFEGAREAA